jgi:carbon-monoxide dehydrogenase small subunit
MDATQAVAIGVTVNGERYERSVEPRLLLSDFLRHELGLSGTHVGCEHGVCGACTVLLDGEPVRACLVFAVQADGSSIGTVEGLERDDGLHPLQAAFKEAHGLQCGFCTPGILMTMVAFLDEVPDPTELQVREALSGNLCRCTGYQKIVEAVEAAAADLGGSQSGETRTRRSSRAGPPSSTTCSYPACCTPRSCAARWRMVSFEAWTRRLPSSVPV